MHEHQLRRVDAAFCGRDRLLGDSLDVSNNDAIFENGELEETLRNSFRIKICHPRMYTIFSEVSD